MSLINDALKKAQAQQQAAQTGGQTGPAATPAPDAPATPEAPKTGLKLKQSPLIPPQATPPAPQEPEHVPAPEPEPEPEAAKETPPPLNYTPPSLISPAPPKSVTPPAFPSPTAAPAGPVTAPPFQPQLSTQMQPHAGPAKPPPPPESGLLKSLLGVGALAILFCGGVVAIVVFLFKQELDAPKNDIIDSEMTPVAKAPATPAEEPRAPTAPEPAEPEAPAEAAETAPAPKEDKPAQGFLTAPPKTVINKTNAVLEQAQNNADNVNAITEMGMPATEPTPQPPVPVEPEAPVATAPEPAAPAPTPPPVPITPPPAVNPGTVMEVPPPLKVTPISSSGAPATGASTAPVPNAETESFVHRLEIRGMMSGGERILVFDPDQEKTKVINRGQFVSPERGLRYTDVKDGEYHFTDNAGAIYIKFQ